MSISNFYMKNIPEYYKTMFLDGYSPQQIRMAAHEKMMREYKERIAAKEEAEPYNIRITSEVKKK